MGSKTCGKCGEQVDEAKAFCPGCGHSFVEEEKRTTVSEFDGSDETMHLGQTMYNQLLADMGLSKSYEASNAEAVVTEIRPEAVVEIRKPEVSARKPAYVKWLILGGIVVFGLVLVVILAAIVILYVLAPRFS